MTDREEFEQQFASIQRVPLADVVACRAGEGYWDEANTNTRGIQTAWLFFRIGRRLV